MTAVSAAGRSPDSNLYRNGRLALAVVALDLAFGAVGVWLVSMWFDVAASSVVGAGLVLAVDLGAVGWFWRQIRFGSIWAVLARAAVAVALVANFVLPQDVDEESGLWAVGYLVSVPLVIGVTVACSAMVDRAVRSGGRSIWLGSLMQQTRR